MPARLLRSCPSHLTGYLVIIVAQRDNLFGVQVVGHYRHELALKGNLAIESSTAGDAVLRLVEAFDGMVGVVVHKGRHARPVDGSHAAAGETVLVVDGHVGSEGTGFADGFAVEGEVFLGEIFGTEGSSERKDSAAAIAIGLDHLPYLLNEWRCRNLRIVPEP